MVILPTMTAMAQRPGPVTLISPPDATIGLSVTPTFKWFSEPSAIDHKIIISTTPSTSNAVVNTFVSDTTFTVVNPLDNGQTYYWAARGKNADGIGPFSDWWSIVTVAGGATQVSLTSPSDGDIDQAVDPVLTWGSVNGASTYHLQVSTSSGFGTTVVDDPAIGTTQFQPVLNPNQTYYWRVKASNAGEFNWSATWSFVTGSGEPAKIVLVSPADGAEGVGTTPELSWESDPVATRYRVQISEASDFSNIIHNTTVVTTSWITPPLANAQTYYWRVRGLGPSGSGPFSDQRSFTVEAGGPTQVELASPSNGAKNVVLDPVLSWSAVSGGAPYRLQVSKLSDFSTTVIDISGIANTQYDVEALDPSTKFYWRVLASNAPPTNWSDTWSFSTGTGGPDQIVLSSPSDGATDVPISTSFSWQADLVAETYRLQVSTSIGFTSKVINRPGITDTTYTPPDALDSETLYFWRVKGVNSVGGGPFSQPFSFTTGASAPGAVTLLSPSDQATNVSATPTLTWEVESESDSYDLQIALTADFAAPVISAIGLTDAEFTSTALAYGTSHFWRVRGANVAGSGPWSQVFSFTTVPGGSQQVVLSSPANGAIDIGLTPLLSWSPVANAVSYALQVSLQSNFSSTVINRDAVTSTQFQTSTLDGQTKYYWRVRASNAGSANWSQSWSFTTSPGTPDQVSLLAPADKSQNVTVNTVLKWNQAQKATSYELQMTKTENDFSETSYEAKDIAGTQHQVPELIYGDVYWWRVRAMNQSGLGAWSESWGYLTERGGDEQPLIVSPVPGETGVSLEPLLIWSLVPGAAAAKFGGAVTYHVQVATSFSFDIGSLVVEDSANPDTTFQVDRVASRHDLRVAGQSFYSRAQQLDDHVFIRDRQRDTYPGRARISRERHRRCSTRDRPDMDRSFAGHVVQPSSFAGFRIHECNSQRNRTFGRNA